MLRSTIALLCTVAILAPAAAFAGERHDRSDYSRGDYNRIHYNNRGDYDRSRTVGRERPIDFYNRERAFERRDDREWNRRDAVRERYWRDRRDYRHDRSNAPRIIIIPRFSF